MRDFARREGMNVKHPGYEETMAVHREAIVVDLHVDTFIWRRLLGYNIRRRHRPLPFGSPFCYHADLPRLREGGVGAVGFGVVTFPFPEGRAEGSARRTIRIARGDLAKSPDLVEVVRDASAIPEVHARGKIAAFLGIEGAHALGGRLDRLAEIRRLGVLYITVVHFTSNPFGHPSNRLRMADRGLTPLGRDLIGEMERHRICVDLAHLNRTGFLEAARLARRPVIVSHTGIAEVRPLWRNIDGEQIRAVAETGGVIGVIFYPGFLTRRSRCGLDAVVDHIDAIRKWGGVETAALGSDFDGMITSLPDGVRDVTGFPLLTEALLRRGYGAEDVKKILGGNALRALREACG